MQARALPHLGANSKTIVEPQQWLAAALDGNHRAMSYIVKHCVQDVLVSEKVIGALKRIRGRTTRMEVGFENASRHNDAHCAPLRSTS